MREPGELHFRFEWEDPAAARGLELRATWARLEILVDGQPITRLVDDANRSLRTSVYLPLYPLAEWLATHWWFLAYEFETPGRSAAADYDRRHSLRYAGEGYALPHLVVHPSGDMVRLAWRATRLEAQRVEFTASGVAHITLDVFQAAARDLIMAVLRRLEDANVSDTPLVEEWSAIERADREEREFCAASAALGLDPYALDEPARDALINAHETLPKSLTSEFFAVAEFGVLQQQVRAVLAAVREAEASGDELRELRALKKAVEADFEASGVSWQQGHRFAQRLRERLALNGQLLNSSAAVAASLRIQDVAMGGPSAAGLRGQSVFDALVAATPEQNPGIVVTAKRPEAQRFAFCRALFEYLSTTGDQPQLVTRARSARQQRNRAFAAEFLAPAHALRERVSGFILGEDEVDELAATFGVSSFVIRHQIENYEIATIRDT